MFNDGSDFNDGTDNSHADNNSPWFSEMPEPGHPNILSLEILRDKALELYGLFISEQSGIDPACHTATLEEKQHFLSMQETENIVRSFSAMDNGEMMAVGGSSPAEAMVQVRKMMDALLQRIMSNVVAEAVRRELVDVSFDDEQDAFAFQVNQNGFDFVEKNKGLFTNDAE